MSSAEETQQPEWRPVRANPVPASSTDIGTSVPNGDAETYNSTSTGQQENSIGFGDWMDNQLAPQSLPLSLDLAIPPSNIHSNHREPEQPTRPTPSAQPGPLAPAKWKTQSSSPSSSQLAPASDPAPAMEDVDELVSDPSSRPKRSQGEEDGPLVSTPSDGGKDQALFPHPVETRPVSTPEPTNLSNSRLAKQIVTTPRKLHPLSTFTPSLSRKRNGGSPTKVTSPSNSPLRPSARTTPNSRRGANPVPIDQDSFGEPPNPRTRIMDMLYQSSKAKAKGSMGDLESAEDQGDNPLNLTREPDPPSVSWDRRQAYRSPTPPAINVRPESSVIIPNECFSGSPHVNGSPSVQPTLHHSPQRPAVNTYSHYADLPSSSGAEMTASQLFSESSDQHDFGTQGTQPTFHPAATQVATIPQHVSPQAVFAMSQQGSDEMPHVPIPSNTSIVSSKPQPVGVGRTPSQISNATSISVAAHRKLVRTNPRNEELVHPIIGPNRPISMPVQTRAAPRLGRPLTDPVGRPGEIEPTQIDDFLGAPPAKGLQDTFMDPAPMSQNPDAPMEEQDPTPRLRLSSLPPSSPAKLGSSPAPQQHEVQLQPTYIDPRSLPSLPPAPRISPKQYIGRRRGRKTVTPEQEDQEESGSPGEVGEDAAGFNRPSPEGPPEDPAPASPNGQADDHQADEQLAPRQRGKRRASQSSDFTTGGGGPDSSPAPEDPEDYTYRPVPRPNGNVSKPSRSKATKTRATRASSASDTGGEPARKRIKLNETTATPSGRSEFRAKREHRVAPSSPLTELPVTPRRLRVWGWWAPEKSWFAGTVMSKHDGKFHIAFDDETSKKLPIDRLRRLELRKGDQIKADASVGKGQLEVAEDWEEKSHDDSRGPQIKEDGQLIGRVSVVEICIPDKVIKERFEDRRVVPSDLGLLEEIKPASSRDKSPVKAGDVFAGKVFLLTTNGTATMKDQEGMVKKIKRHGGKVEDDWKRLFDLSKKDGFNSTIKVKEAPFLIAIGGEGLTPKAIAALASGIPCLAATFVDAAIDRDVDWRPYLISPGISKLLGTHGSQLVDPTWSSSNWTANRARSPRQPFADLAIIFLVPKGDSKRLEMVRDLVPFCVHAMGATSLVSIKSTTDRFHMASYDIVLIETQGEGQVIPDAWKASGKLCDFGWLKQCLIAGARLPAEVVSE